MYGGRETGLRLTTRAGFEIGSSISINPSLPEADAEVLNSLR